MKQKSASSVVAVESSRSRFPLLPLLVGAFALVIPIFVFPGDDLFRVPKELFLRQEAIVLGAVMLCELISGRRRESWRALVREPSAILAALIVAWSAITTLTSVNRVASQSSLAYITSMAVVFIGTFIAFRRGGIVLAVVPFAPAAVNTGVMLLEHLHVWSPYPIVRGRWVATGLVGNSSDAGCYLMVATIAAAAVSLASRRWRWIAAAAALCFAFGTFMSAALTAVGALAIGLAVLTAMRSFRLVIITMVVVLILGLLTVTFYPPVHQRITRLSRAYAEGDVDQFFSFRFVAYATAGLMAADHPLTGVGPGAYGSEFFDYRDKAEQRFPSLRESGALMFNFGEAHNDHLQVLAQSGIPGYLLFLAALVLVGRVWRQPRGQSEEALVAHYLALPLVASFGVLALAQFPLELTAPLHAAIHYGAAVLAWRSRP